MRRASIFFQVLCFFPTRFNPSFFLPLDVKQLIIRGNAFCSFEEFYWVKLNHFGLVFTSEKSHNCILKFHLASFWDVFMGVGDAEFFPCFEAVVVVGSPAQFCAGGL